MESLMFRMLLSPYLAWQLVRVGSRVYFPVNAEGAGLAVGDMHACMGDGELSGTGIEIAGRMCLRVTVYHDRPIERPVIETADSLYFLASRRTLEESVKVGTEDAVNFLMKKFDLNFPDAYRLMSATCDAQISEVVDDNVASGFIAYCRKNYKWYNECKCDKRMSPVMRLPNEKSVLF